VVENVRVRGEKKHEEERTDTHREKEDSISLKRKKK